MLKESSKFFRDIGRIFSGPYLLWQLVAIAVTYALVLEDVDWWVRATVRGTSLYEAAMLAGLIGFFVPVALPLAMLIAGHIKKNASLVATGWLIARAEITALLLSFFYKFFTGRPGPVGLDLAPAVTDTSHIFHFGFLQGGVFWGWPSSHILVAVAASVVLAIIYKQNVIVKYLALAYAFYMATAVSITFHWFSDGVAGVIFGTVVGLVIANGYRKDTLL